MSRMMFDTVAEDRAVQIAEYVCGLLRPEEHAKVHVLLSRDDAALAQALAWEDRLLALVDALPRAQPDAAVRERLQRTLGIGPPPAFQPPPQPQLLRQRSVDTPSTPVGPLPSLDAIHPATPKSSQAAIKTPIRPRDAKDSPGASAAQAGRREAFEQKDAAPIPPADVGRIDATRQLARDVAIEPESAHSDRASSSDPGDAEQQMNQNDGDDMRRKLVRKLYVWRLLAISAAAAATFAFVMPGDPPPPPVQIVKLAPTRAAILQAPGTSSTPGWTATFDPQGNLLMRPLVQTEVPVGSQALLWTRSEKISAPRLLGRIDPNRPVHVPSAQLGAIADDQLLEITLETDEDASNGTPNGPILFIGQFTVFGSDAVAAPASGRDTAASSEAAASGRVTPAGTP